MLSQHTPPNRGSANKHSFELGFGPPPRRGHWPRSGSLLLSGPGSHDTGVAFGISGQGPALLNEA